MRHYYIEIKKFYSILYNFWWPSLLDPLVFISLIGNLSSNIKREFTV